MFTGIIRYVGNITKIKSQESSSDLVIASSLGQEVAEGDSVAVNGTCLTVLSHSKDTLTFRLMAETLKRTNLGNLKLHMAVNLERPLRPDQPLDGHFVQGHVDGLATVTNIESIGGDKIFTFKVSADLLPYLIPKGSVALDGVSLTVVDVNDATHTFTVSIMPYTLEHTVFGKVEVGYHANLEVDMIGKYVRRFTDYRHHH